MLTIERTHDMDLVRRIATDPHHYRWAADDYSPPREDWEPEDNPRVWFLVYGKVALFTATPQNGVCWEIHCAVLPSVIQHGETADAAKAAFAYLFEHTPCQRIVAAIAEDNRAAIKLAKRVGMTSWGRNPLSFQRNGALLDMWHFGISREDFK